MVARGEMTIAKAERILGTISILSHTGRSIYADSSGRRRLAELRHLGISPEAVAPAENVVPVGRLLRESLASWTTNEGASDHAQAN